MDKMMAYFEESVNKMTQIKERFIRMMEEERRDMLKLREKYGKEENETNNYRKNYNYGP